VAVAVVVLEVDQDRVDQEVLVVEELVEQLTVQEHNHLQTLQVDHLHQLIQVVAVVALEQDMTGIVMEMVEAVW
tara:strand:+ start:658 stop:879 length:222 start_codon:yes stop_codon:yes gene_type:complete